MRDMPSYGSRVDLEAAERADEYFILLSNASQMRNIEALRRVLAADARELAGMVAADHDNINDAIRNLQVYSGALARLADVAFERFLEAETSNDDRTVGALNGAAHPVGLN